MKIMYDLHCNATILIYLYMLYISFYATITNLCSCDRDHKADKVLTISYSAFFGICLPTLPVHLDFLFI